MDEGAYLLFAVAIVYLRRVTAPRHVPVLDGVRGVAVLLVMAFHLSWSLPDTTLLARALKPILFKGWMGVDLFFVLSGYLITLGLIGGNHASLGLRFRDFYVRRSLRIFPLYYATIAIGSVICLLANVSPPGAVFWLYVQNYVQARDLDTEAWTGHLWSLAIEEQFYLVWPAAMLLFPRRRVPVTLALFVAGIAARVWVVFQGGMDAEHASHWVYRVTFTHADGLLAGALLAIGDRSTVWRRARMAVIAIVIALYVVPKSLSHERLAICAEPLMLAGVFAAVVSFAVEGTATPTLARLFSSRTLRECGRVSYGMYLFHWPLYVLAMPTLKRWNETLSPWSATALHLALVPLGSLVVFLLARASYRFFEAPILSLKARFSA